MQFLTTILTIVILIIVAISLFKGLGAIILFFIGGLSFLILIIALILMVIS